MPVFNYTTFILFLLAGTLANLFLKNFFIGALFGIPFLLFCGYRFAGIVFKNENLYRRLFFGIPLVFAIIIILGTPIYYFYKLDGAAIAAICILMALLSLIPNKKPDAAKIRVKIKFNLSSIIFSAVFIIFEIILFYFIFKAQTSDAIRTPWDVINKKFFIFYFLASATLIYLFLKDKMKSLNLALLGIHTFLTLSIALVVYKIGYGFDPFIHRATEELIYKTGAVFPKPFYYLGQYSLVVFLSKIISAPVLWIDKLLLPVLASIFLPPTLYWSFKDKNTNVPLVILMVPLTQFITTTPQGLANFFALFAVILSIGSISLAPLAIFSIASLFIHPLAGIPAIIFVGLKILGKIKIRKLKAVLLAIFLFFSSIIIPAIFIAREKIFYDSWKGIIKIPDLPDIFPTLPFFENRYGIFFDFIYFLENNLIFIFLLLVIFGLYFGRKKFSALPYLLAAAIIFINSIILKLFINFPSVINYEQADYANRLLRIAGFFLLPFAIFSFIYFFEKLRAANFPVKIFFISVLAFIMTSSIYLTYPRVDRYELSHNINTSISDMNAVHFIEKDAAGADYIVLANQAVSAAALQEFGFKKYFKTDTGEMFYYPIPTGGPLYEFYLSMVYKNLSRETMEDVMKLAGVKQSYFVLNGYWTNSDRILEQAQKEADSWFVVNSKDTFKNDDGALDSQAVFVLKYSIR